LYKWYGYLDLFGALSSWKYAEPSLNMDYMTISEEGQSMEQLDCFLGFSLRTMALLTDIAVLTEN
jgi:hypothetical protein